MVTLLVAVLFYDIKLDAVIPCFLFFDFIFIFQFLIKPRHVLREFGEIVRPFGLNFFDKIMCCSILQMDLNLGPAVVLSMEIDIELLWKFGCC